MRGMRCHMNVSQLDVQRQVAVRIRHISRDHLTLCGQTQTEQYEVHDGAGYENHNMRWWPTIDGDGGDGRPGGALVVVEVQPVGPGGGGGGVDRWRRGLAATARQEHGEPHGN